MDEAVTGLDVMRDVSWWDVVREFQEMNEGEKLSESVVKGLGGIVGFADGAPFVVKDAEHLGPKIGDSFFR